jgi:glycosyltransferase involved in cell wall biosynthesis
MTLTTWSRRVTPPSRLRTARTGCALVSVVTVCRNAAATLEACVASVAGQTWPAIDYVVVDGASTDDTPAILQRHRGAIATLVSEPDRGIYDAMNKGLARARGDFVIFLNADDRFVGPTAVADAMAAIARAPEADVYYGSLEIRHGQHSMRHDPPPPGRAAEEMVLGCLPHQATFARHSVFDRTGPFDLRWRVHADYDWWLKVLANPQLRLQRIDTLVASYATGGTSTNLAKGQPEVFAIQNNAPLFRTPEWDRRRIEIYQNAVLSLRLQLIELQGGRAPWLLPHGLGPLRSWLMRHLPEPAVGAIRAAKRRLFGPRA